MLFDGPVPTLKAASSGDAAMPTQETSGGVNEVSVVGEVDAARPETRVRLASGEVVVLPTAMLLQGLRGVEAAPAVAAPETASHASSAGDVMTIPLIAEQAEISKKTVTTGTVRLHKGVETYTDNVTLPITRTGWDVERTTIGQLLAERPEVRQEGDVTVFPLVEERLVARREYFLLEEVRVRRVETTTERTATLELKRDVLTVEREGAVDGTQG